MAEPYTIRIFVLSGEPEGVKIVDRLNWTGIGICFPRAAWLDLRGRPEFDRAGVYVLTGPAEADDDLPLVYVGQGDGVRDRLDAHYAKKDFWDWAYTFVSSNSGLNRAHITWLEYALLTRAHAAQRCVLDNANQPREPGLTEAERADTDGFLREMLRILPLLNVRVFEKPKPIAVPAAGISPNSGRLQTTDDRDTVIVPAQQDGFREVFLGQSAWYAIRIRGGMLPKIKYIAAYQSAPISAITHYAPVERIEPYGDEGKYRLVFSAPAKPVGPIPFADAPPGSMQGPRYVSLSRLLSAKKVTDTFPREVAANDD